MEPINLSLLSDLFQKVWGSTPDFNPEIADVTGDVPDLQRNDFGEAAGSPLYGNDPIMGFEYYLPVKITYTNTAGVNVDMQLSHPIVGITSKVMMIETPLTERRGTVKQIINIEDYQITVKGFIIGATNELPERDIATLRELYETGRPINMANAVTDIFLVRPGRKGSDQVVIKDMRLPEVKGVKNVRPYELIMVSDEPFNLIDLS